ncbi:50S ribosomal protein L4 [Eubacterium saphenum ATCC 49989]|nr:50S ribosomal protein L4 [Eubacterium saphenum ATCC 49989]
MSEVNMMTIEGKDAGKLKLSDAVFGITPNENAVREVIKNFLANNRQGTQSAKTRGDVRGGGRKPFRQKGTGRARQGSTTDPTKVGGGVAFAPKPRSYSYTLPKKVKKLAMISALSSKAQNKELIVLDKLEIADYRTKDVVEMLKNVKAAKKALIVTADKDEKVVKSAANIPNVETTNVSRMNVYEIVNHTNFIATKAAIEKIEEVYA